MRSWIIKLNRDIIALDDNIHCDFETIAWLFQIILIWIEMCADRMISNDYRIIKLSSSSRQLKYISSTSIHNAQQTYINDDDTSCISSTINSDLIPHIYEGLLYCRRVNFRWGKVSLKQRIQRKLSPVNIFPFYSIQFDTYPYF